MSSTTGTVGQGLARAARRLDRRLAPLVEGTPPRPGITVLNPAVYARANLEAYLHRHASPGVEAVLVGMNPGPWGMGQTGVPFGDPASVTGFLGIGGDVAQPVPAHPRFVVRGVASPRAEVSGQRIWGGAARCFGAPGPFFRRFFVANYCPLLFLDAKGTNVTPDKLPAAWLEPVLEACDAHLVESCRVLQAARVVGVGAWATRRVALALRAAGLNLPVATVLHPSPASPAANRGWLPTARAQLAAAGCPWPPPAGAP